MNWDLQRLRADLLAVLLLSVIVFVGLSLWSYDPQDPPAAQVYPQRTAAFNICGEPGAYVSHALHLALGWGAYVAWGVLIALDVRLFSRQAGQDLPLRILGGTLVLISASVAADLYLAGMVSPLLVGRGGYVGVWGQIILGQHLEPLGALSVVGSTFIAGALLLGDWLLFGILGWILWLPLRLICGPRTAKPKESSWPSDDELPSNNITEEAADFESAPVPDDPDPELEADWEAPPAPQTTPVAAPRPPIRVNRPAALKPRPEPAYEADPAPVACPLPDVEILEEAEEFPYELLAKKARLAAETLERSFKEFGLNVRVVEIDTGPVITQFELELEAGLRLSKVTALADDLAIALRVPSVRVVAPIPGKNTVGVEVPNDKQVMVRLRELIEASPAEINSKRIPIFLGKDVSGRPLVVDLAKMPHLLIAGRTGTGKSVCLNTLILSMLMTRTPEQVKMLMIDPKMVELSPYTRIPHLMHPVITDMKKAEAILAWAVDKMEERYDLLARCGVRHLDSYNKLGKNEVLNRVGADPDSPEASRIPETMPYIVIIADEMADMMMTSGKEVEGHIIRLAQKSRAVGIHLVLATQKPTVDVITGLIKSNLPARIAFQVASRVDSRVVLDEMGADKLLGNGDMLYLAPGTSHLNRAQGTFVSDEEVNQIIEFYSDQEPQYSRELAAIKPAGDKSAGAGDVEALRKRDDMYEQAIEIVIREGRGSTSLLQRALGIGYGRAARLIDFMAEDGIVGEFNGSQARDVLYTLDQWQAFVDGEELADVS